LKTLGAVLLLALCGAVVGAPRAAHAQAAQVDDAKARARVHFDRALAASNDQRYDDAAREFEEAYALAPDFKVLYNIGRVCVVLGRPVRAVEAFEAYLAEGGPRISDERREEVRRLIDSQRPKLASLGVETQAGAEIRVDGRLVGRAPLPQRLLLTAGAHTVEALSADRPPILREVTLAGDSTTDLTLAFPAPAAPAAPAAAPRATLTLDPAGAPDATPHRARRIAGYVTGGVGLLAMVAGATLAYQGAVDANNAKGRLVDAAMPAPPAMPDLAKYDAAKISYDDAKTKNELGWATAAVGGVALGVGVALIITSSSPSSAPHVVASRDTLGLAGTW
jgi:hypothetical protein